MVYKLFFLIMVIAHNTYAQQEQSFDFDVGTHQQDYRGHFSFLPQDQSFLDQLLQDPTFGTSSELVDLKDVSQELQEGIEQSDFSVMPEKKVRKRKALPDSESIAKKEKNEDPFNSSSCSPEIKKLFKRDLRGDNLTAEEKLKLFSYYARAKGYDVPAQDALTSQDKRMLRNVYSGYKSRFKSAENLKELNYKIEHNLESIKKIVLKPEQSAFIANLEEQIEALNTSDHVPLRTRIKKDASNEEREEIRKLINKEAQKRKRNRDRKQLELKQSLLSYLENILAAQPVSSKERE